MKSSLYPTYLCCFVSLVSHADKSLQLLVQSLSDGRVTRPAHDGPRVLSAPCDRLVTPAGLSGSLGAENVLPIRGFGLAGITRYHPWLSRSRGFAHAGDMVKENIFRIL